MPHSPTPRRHKLRHQTAEEALTIALRQLVEGGAGAISLNAIARELGMTGPALYRYFPNRDALLTELVVRAYGDLAAALWTSVDATSGQSPSARLRHQAVAYRAWALEHPHRYLLLFGTPVPGYHAPEAETRPAALRMFAAALTLMTELVPASWPPPSSPTEAAFEQWLATADLPPMPGEFARQLFSGWTRLHGVLSLELEGHFSAGLPSGELLYATEVDSLVRDLETALTRFTEP